MSIATAPKPCASFLWTPAHLNTEGHTAVVAEVVPAVAEHHNQPAAGTVGTSDLKKDKRKKAGLTRQKKKYFYGTFNSLPIQTH